MTLTTPSFKRRWMQGWILASSERLEREGWVVHPTAFGEGMKPWRIYTPNGQVLRAANGQELAFASATSAVRRVNRLLTI